MAKLKKCYYKIKVEHVSQLNSVTDVLAFATKSVSVCVCLLLCIRGSMLIKWSSSAKIHAHVREALREKHPEMCCKM